MVSTRRRKSSDRRAAASQQREEYEDDIERYNREKNNDSSLDESDDGEDLSESEEEEEALPLGEAGSDSEDGGSSDLDSEEEIEKGTKYGQLLKQARAIKAKLDIARGEDEESESSEESSEEEDEEEEDGWGARKSAYYNADNIDMEGSEEEEDLQAEEEEARRLQKEAASRLQTEDYGEISSEEEEGSEDDLGDNVMQMDELDDDAKDLRAAAVRQDALELKALLQELRSSLSESEENWVRCCKKLNQGILHIRRCYCELSRQPISGAQAEQIQNGDILSHKPRPVALVVDDEEMLRARMSIKMVPTGHLDSIQFQWNLMRVMTLVLEDCPLRNGESRSTHLERLQEAHLSKILLQKLQEHQRKREWVHQLEWTRRGAEAQTKARSARGGGRRAYDSEGIPILKKGKDGQYPSQERQSLILWKKRETRVENEFYQATKRHIESQKKQRRDAMAPDELHPPMAEPVASGARKIDSAIEKNRGLTPHRRKDLKNPRKKHRIKFAEANVRRKGQVQSVKTGAAGA
eukprot:jgi/Picre1/31606/NNA_006958.t1